MTQNNQFKFILNLAHIIKFLVPTLTKWDDDPFFFFLFEEKVLSAFCFKFMSALVSVQGWW